MKKRNIKKIAFKKSIVSNLATDSLKGGTRTSNLCSAVCTGQCPPMTDGCFTLDNASACKCL
ncbi:hypothetical protein H2O64_00905 [Kordia sp. YSTF-M3]|uniref:Bacteriocin n=1 Tax=Kordia aestuariivivens TaxID=2759037 RepID=A0ABR7Q3S5_9FLAO|nr:hypothetical protein [Kordia aestuariivivens]MBC8753207.1 hypothetical protein [Kordia aestuariivivens]